jgi:hypothetical protein
MIIEIREAYWTAPVLWHFAKKRKIRRISAELFCANDNLICYRLLTVGDSPKPEAAERFPGIIFENPPFILEKRRILLQGSLSV